MKKVSVIFLILSFLSCKNHLNIISAIKQTVIPGVQSAKPYSNYIFKIDIKDPLELKLERVLVVENKQCYQSKFFIKKQGVVGYPEKIQDSGVYILETAIKEGNYSIIENCNIDKNKVILFYSINGKKQKTEIDSFIEEQKRRR